MFTFEPDRLLHTEWIIMWCRIIYFVESIHNAIFGIFLGFIWQIQSVYRKQQLRRYIDKSQGDVAQSEERLVRNQQAPGSKPGISRGRYQYND